MDFSVLHMFEQMGMVAKGVVALLLVMSIYSIAVSVERWFRFRRGRIQSQGYVTAIQKILSSNGRIRNVAGLDQRWAGSPIAKVIGGGVSGYVRDVDALGVKVEDRAEVELLVDGVSRSMERGKDRGDREHATRVISAGHDRIVGTLRRPVRHGLRNHHSVPEYGGSQQRRRRTGDGVRRHLGSVVDDGGRSGRRDRVGMVLQLLHVTCGGTDDRRR